MKQNLRIMRTAPFQIETVLKDVCFTKTGKLRRNNEMRKLIADSLRYEGHKFIETLTTEDIINNSTIEMEEVEVFDEDQGQL